MSPSEFVQAYLNGVEETIDFHSDVLGEDRDQVVLYYLHIAIMSHDYQVNQKGRNPRFALKILLRNEKKILQEKKELINYDN